MSIFDDIKIQRLETFKTVINGAKKGLSKQQLVERLGTNSKTVERYVNDLRDFGIAIVSTGRPVRYSIDYDNSYGFELFEYILSNQLMSTQLLSMINEKDKSKQYLFDYVDFEHHNEFKGLVHFDKLFNAIANKNEIRFSYKSYYTNCEKEVSVQPFLLKEYYYRWYLAGFKNNGEIRTYGLDRILSEINFTGEHFVLDKSFNRKQYYQDTIGVTISKQHETIEPVEIVFEIDKTIAKHAESLKIHSSQKVLESSDRNVVRFSIFARPNFEMWHTFLQYIPQIKIVSPTEIKLEFLKLLQETIAKNS